MRILVTGLNGFTGGYLKAELESNGHVVIGLTCNLLDASKLTAEISAIQPEAVVHLAAVAFVAHASPEDFYQVNLLGSRNLLESLAKYAPAVQSILLASSAHVYGNSEQEILCEGTPTCPANDYAVSKLAMEYMAKLWADRLPLFIVRPFNYTGVGQAENFLIPKIVRHFHHRDPILELGNLDVWREFGDVRAVVEIYRKLLELKPRGEIINVCTQTAHSLREVLAIAEKVTNHHPEIRINPSYVRQNEIHRLMGDNTHLKQLVGEWTNISFAETLQWMLNSDHR